MKKRVADIIVDCLIKNGITDCFSVVGGGAMHLNNAFVLRNEINKIYCHHEQACTMAAESYARMNGKLAAVCVTSGPGGTNAINGVQGAYVESIPMIVISGHPRYETTVPYTGLNLRIRGVQENDIVYMAKKITKYAKFITDASEIRKEIQKAIDIAMDGRRGPVWIDVPLNIQGMIVDDVDEDKIYEIEKNLSNNIQIQECMEIVKNAQRPCILTGSGIRSSNCIEEFREFCDCIQIPIVGGVYRADISYNKQKMYYGMSGSAGLRTGNFIVQNADVILVLGNSLSFFQTGYNQELFAPNAKIIMVDIDYDEGKKPGLNVYKIIHSDLRDFFKCVIKDNIFISASDKWIEYCNKIKNRFPSYEALSLVGEIKETDRVPVLLFWKEFLSQCKNDCILALGNSSCVHGVLQEGIDYPAQRIISNCNCGSMGYDLPAAVGAAVASGKEVFCITGDGSIMMNLQELQTIKHYKLKIKIIIFSNEGYGAIRNTCSNFFNGVYTGCDDKSGVSFPDFGRVAEAFSMPYYRCDDVSALYDALQWIEIQSGACILEIKQCINEVRAPRLESKMDENGVFITPALHDMSPFLSQEEIESLMYRE